MIGRRSALKAIFMLISALVSYLFIYKWINIISNPNLSLLHKKKSLIAEIAEIMIPRTETPGAKDVKVEDFILGMIEFCTDIKTQNSFINGLERFELHCLNNYHHSFLKCSHQEQIQILTYFEKDAKFRYNIINKINNKILGKPFIVKFKELAVEGYCTSKLGATIGLAYDYLPVRYDGCVILQQNQKSWATR
ncbi:gluconate 2-dehydrogenase subunit 3 family protein [Pedobacter psychroterrae]|uniref:Gluconate 2-dehydrogenase subunit 3 family protein n=1 Tax=Pedobacter psychroterrae TaxID=2530453 RepID=A0A4R0NLN4_9SPHI|nr:gluconate 2-dehydrogenase subunit 3 family protein [Pedobacter psychroterrae]TCD01701.1 gluconate 2-dehydrogenase subunit 3 family protein [Pedobacter psychroterrae]